MSQHDLRLISKVFQVITLSTSYSVVFARRRKISEKDLEAKRPGELLFTAQKRDHKNVARASYFPASKFETIFLWFDSLLQGDVRCIIHTALEALTQKFVREETKRERERKETREREDQVLWVRKADERQGREEKDDQVKCRHHLHHHFLSTTDLSGRYPEAFITSSSRHSSHFFPPSSLFLQRTSNWYIQGYETSEWVPR